MREAGNHAPDGERLALFVVARIVLAGRQWSSPERTLMARKITLAEAAESGAVALTVFCAAGSIAGGGCTHSGKIAIGEALKRWPSTRRLDELRVRCTACGASGGDARPDFGDNHGRPKP
jgi:hypothetical protein